MRFLLQLSDPASTSAVSFTLNGGAVAVDDGISLLDALRNELACPSVKDGCSPQGQCGCCTVWVDGLPRVSCVTPIRRVAGRVVTTLEGWDPDLRERWVEAFVATGASQCGFCTPGILLRLAALEQEDTAPTRDSIEAALRAHLCRCTGWQSIVSAASIALGLTSPPPTLPRDQLLAAWRAQLEGPTFQSSGPEVILGGGGFADDTAPAGARIHLGAADVPLAATMRQARQGRGRVQGRNSTVPLGHPIPLPPGEWDLTLQTTWVEPAYVETDASWCTPGSHPATPLANGGAFGGKRRSPVPAAVATLSEEAGGPVRLLWSREDVVRRGPKRPPLALGLKADGSGVVRVGRTPGSPDLTVLRQRLLAVAPDVLFEEVETVGPPVGPELRGAVWAEVAAAIAALASGAARGIPTATATASVTLQAGGRAAVTLDLEPNSNSDGITRGAVHVEVWAGEVLDPVTLRSYALGAVHQALGLVWSEGIAVNDEGVPVDLTIRSFGILAARDMPEVEVVLHEDDRWPVNGSDAVFAATMAAAWMAEGFPPSWPTRRTGGHAPAPAGAGAVAPSAPSRARSFHDNENEEVQP